MMEKEKNKIDSEKKIKGKCGIIMPIASHPDYPIDHWKDVLNILKDAISTTEFEPNLVSDDVAIGLIHDRIVTNIYTNDIIVCDVSSKNPNVMFELGMRLAFDKPTIIIKDESTGYSFDTGVIEHISYPSSLRFSQIVSFKEELVRKINATYQKSKNEPDYSPFLKSFGKTIVPSKVQQTSVTEGNYIIEQLQKIRNEMHLLRGYDRRTEERNKSSFPELKIFRIAESIISKLEGRLIYEIVTDFKLNNLVRDEFLDLGIELTSKKLSEIIFRYGPSRKNLVNIDQLSTS